MIFIQIFVPVKAQFVKIKAYLPFLFQAYASRGYVAIAIDSRYHGERATNITTYRDVCILMPCSLVMKFWLIDTKITI